jgi:YfiH family protein
MPSRHMRKRNSGPRIILREMKQPFSPSGRAARCTWTSIKPRSFTGGILTQNRPWVKEILNLARQIVSGDNDSMDFLSLNAPSWEGRGAPLHGFLGRRGGKSTGTFAGLNLSFRVGDDPVIVKDNFCDMKKAVGVHNLRITTMRQVHGEHIVDVADDRLKEAGEADGMATDKTGVFLGVLTADCVPILFSVRGQNVAAVAHAGWRGTLAGIAGKMVRHLKDRYKVDAGSVEAALGPSIGPCCYEIGADVSRPLTEKWGRLAQKCLQSRDVKQYLDLRELNRLLLHDAGVPQEQIFQIGPCTSCAREDFFSYRRDKDTGRQISFIGWQP